MSRKDTSYYIIKSNIPKIDYKNNKYVLAEPWMTWHKTVSLVILNCRWTARLCPRQVPRDRRDLPHQVLQRPRHVLQQRLPHQLCRGVHLWPGCSRCWGGQPMQSCRRRRGIWIDHGSYDSNNALNISIISNKLFLQFGYLFSFLLVSNSQILLGNCKWSKFNIIKDVLKESYVPAGNILKKYHKIGYLCARLQLTMNWLWLFYCMISFV